MNTIKITQGKPDPNYNTIFTFSHNLFAHYEHMRKYFSAELTAGIEKQEGDMHTWKMNLSASKIDMVTRMLKRSFTEHQTPHGFTEEIIPGETFQSLKK